MIFIIHHPALKKPDPLNVFSLNISEKGKREYLKFSNFFSVSFELLMLRTRFVLVA